MIIEFMNAKNFMLHNSHLAYNLTAIHNTGFRSTVVVVLENFGHPHTSDL